MHTKKFLLSAGLSAILYGISSLTYAAGEAIRLKSVAQVEKSVVDKNGNKTSKLVPVEKAIPATEVIYTTTFENVTDKPVGDVVIDNPIPNNSVYKPGSAFGKDFDIQFSADAGRKYAQAAQLTVTGADGKARLATANDYTHIRWTRKGQLVAGSAGTVGFRAVIN